MFTHPRNIFAAGGLVVVHIDPLELEVGGAAVGAGGVDAVLVGDDLPELGPDLVAALAGLDVDDLPHGGGVVAVVAGWRVSGDWRRHAAARPSYTRPHSARCNPLVGAASSQLSHTHTTKFPSSSSLVT